MMSLGSIVTSFVHDTVDYCGDTRYHSGPLKGMECHWGLLWTNDTSTVVYCKELDVFGDYCEIMCLAQLNIVEISDIRVSYWGKRNAIECYSRRIKHQQRTTAKN